MSIHARSRNPDRLADFPILTIVDVALAIPAGVATAFLVSRFAPAPRLMLAMIAACIAIAVWASLVMPANDLAPLTCLLGWALVALSAVDALTFRLPDVITLPLIAAGLIATIFLTDGDIMGHAIGACAGFIFFTAVAWAYRRLRGHDGLGLGDAKLLAGAGAWLGWAALPSVVLIACAAGLAWVCLHAAMRGRSPLAAKIPFGVPLCAALWIVWLYGPLGLS
jgi:leader peptidase (prepilin peptidase)/N-methyltransferase